jgi:SAM-dependent methyltransferase
MSIDVERAHEEAWYRRALDERFFEREGFRRLVQWNLSHLCRCVPMSRATRVLSLGAGLGDYELALAPRVGSILGIDLSETAVAEATRRARLAGAPNAEFRCAAIEELDVAPGSVDVIYALGVLHHVPERPARRAIIEQAYRWIAPGGWLYVRDPNRRGLPRRLGYGLLRAKYDIHSPNEDHLDPAEIAADVAAAGFRHLRVDYTDVLMGPLPWVTRSGSAALWNAVRTFDRMWLGTPGLRRLASQFAIIARR